MLAKLWMTESPVTVSADETIADAKRLLEENSIRRLPVLNESNDLIGILTTKDVQNALPSLIDAGYDATDRVLSEQAKISTFMTPNPITAKPEDPLEDIAWKMRKNKIGCVPIVKDSRPVGIVSESDIFNALTHLLGKDGRGIRVEIVMGNDQLAIYRVMEVLEDHQVEFEAIALCNDFSETKRLLTMRIVCPDTEKCLDELWSAGVQINSIHKESSD